ncbi:MAG: hypothetical protein J0I28_01105, partial [Caulobacterales bacterium]|nr:hypothetical protein [Caulobacterales bacterium]
YRDTASAAQAVARIMAQPVTHAALEFMDALALKLARDHAPDADVPQAGALFRDPSGHVEALGWRLPQGWVAASELPPELAAGAQPRRLALDWDALAALLRDPRRVTDRLALQGLLPVSPGAMRRVLAGGEEQILWSPAAFAAAPHASYEASREAVASAVDASVAAELSGDRPVLIEISGGVDSAIVATTAARFGARDRGRFINFHTADRMGDERAFARAVAARAGVALIEIGKPELTLDAAALAAMPIGVRPSVNSLDHHYDAAVAEQAEAAGADRILTGQGGDIVFVQSPTPNIAHELWGRHVRRPRADPLWRQLEAAARWNRRSVWSLLGEAVRLRAAADALEKRSGRDLPPAKLGQMSLLARRAVFHGASLRGRQARLVHPLLHQPLLEAVLAAPVIDLARGGLGRSLAKDAFVGRLPDVVLQRRSKGDLTAYYGRMALRSLSVLREYLLEGRLAQEGLIDPAGVSAALDADRLIHEGDYPRLFRIVALEAFVRYWEGRLATRPSPTSEDSDSRSASQGSTAS